MKQYIEKNLETLFIFIATFGYIIAYFDIFHSDFFSHTLNIVVRIITFIISIFLIYKNIEFIKKNKNVIIIFCIFYLFYIFKFIYTLNFYPFNDDVVYAKVNELFIYYGLITIPIPVIALISLDYKKVDFKILYKIIFYFLLFLLGIGSTTIKLSKFFIQEEYWVFRSYYILYGHYGVSLLIICLLDLFFIKKLSKNLIFLGIIISVFLIYYSTARSPVLAALVLSVIILMNKKNRKYWVIFFIICVIFVLVLFLANYYHIESKFFQRNYNAIFKGDGSGRSYYLNKGLEEFLKNPIIGGRTLFEDGSYPHNFLLDILMSTGIVGFSLMVVYYYYVFRKTFLIVKNIKFYKEISIFALFFIQYFILNQTSGCVYLGFEEWYFGAIVIGLINSKNYEKT